MTTAPPARPTRTTSARDLLDMELASTSDVQEFARRWADSLRRQAAAIEMAAAELRGRLSIASGMERFAAAQKARRIGRRLQRASSLLDAAGSEVAKMWALYTREYSEQIQPRRRGNGKAWEFRK